MEENKSNQNSLNMNGPGPNSNNGFRSDNARIIVRHAPKGVKNNLLKGGISAALGFVGGASALSLMSFVVRAEDPMPPETEISDNLTAGTTGSENNVFAEDIAGDIDAVVIYLKTPFATGVSNEMSFSEAFTSARQELGPGGFLEWKGNTYCTYFKDEWDSLSDSDKNDFWETVSENTVEIVKEEIPEFADIDLDKTDDFFYDDKPSTNDGMDKEVDVKPEDTFEDNFNDDADKEVNVKPEDVVQEIDINSEDIAQGEGVKSGDTAPEFTIDEDDFIETVSIEDEDNFEIIDSGANEGEFSEMVFDLTVDGKVDYLVINIDTENQSFSDGFDIVDLNSEELSQKEDLPVENSDFENFSDNDSDAGFEIDSDDINN
ncbi:MAG: hypothetical protein PHT69_04550 [Bacteroidales bacterium]|nr:hypothetical protein [Bacteroidales bacterium]